jgi:hypothetical protein
VLGQRGQEPDAARNASAESKAVAQRVDALMKLFD